MSDRLPVAGGSGGAVSIPATTGDVASIDQGGASASAHAERGVAAAASPSTATAELGSALNELAGELRLSEWQLHTYRSWFARNEQRLTDTLGDQAVEEQLAADRANADQCERTLRGEWGASYDGNVARIKQWLNGLPPDLSDAILKARYLNGDAICADPTALRALLQASGQSMENKAPDRERRMLEIEALMRDTSSEYWKGPRAEAIQAEYRELLRQQQERRS